MKRIVLLFCLMSTLYASAQVNWYVKPVASGFGNGSSWANAIDLQTALANTNIGDVLWLSSGTYNRHATDRNLRFVVSSRDLKIYGGFAGTETALSQRVFGANETILSGDLSNNDSNTTDYTTNYSNLTRADNSYHILEIDNSGSGLLLDRITFSGAHNNESFIGTYKGGAILKHKSVSELTLKDCIIRDNVSKNGNAGILAEFELFNGGGLKGEFTIENCKFINNMSKYATGIYAYTRANTDVNINITNTLFDENITDDLSASDTGISGSAGWIRVIGDNSDINLSFINNTLVNNISKGTHSSINVNNHAVLAVSSSTGGSGKVLSATIGNTIFWNNKTIGNVTSKSITDLYDTSITSVNVYNSIDETGFNDSSITSLTAASSSNPLFTNLANGDYTLTSSSPALNSGDNSKIPSGISTDLAGNQRITNTTVDMGAYEKTAINYSTTWTGTTSDDWNTPTNWTNGVPTITTNAIIPNGTPNDANINTLLAVTNNLEIQAGANLTINSEKNLTIEGDLTINNNGTVEMSSIAEQSASLILKGIQSGTGKILFNRGLTNNWHLLSSPVIGQDMADSDITSNLDINGVKYALAPYNNSLPTSRYTYYTTAAGTNNINNAGNFLVGKGYAVKRDGAGYYLGFTGTLNTSDVSIAITDGSATGNKWNLVGNPFTASIQANSNAHATHNFLTVNAAQLDPARVAMYVWNSANGSYDIINQATVGSKYIAPGQGFFVEAKNGGGTIQFTEAMQSHQTGNIFSRTENKIPSIKLMLSDGTIQKNTTVKYFSNATIGLDPGYDAGTFSGETASFNVYTHLVSNDTTTPFGIQSLPTKNYENMVTAVGVNAAANTTLSFSANVDNLPNGMNVYLEDKVENTFTQLNTAQDKYEAIISTAVNGVGRFYLHTTQSVLGIDKNQIALKSINIYKSNSNTLQITGLPKEGRKAIQIFNVLGKEVFNKSFTGQEKATIQLPENILTGVYIIKLKTAKGNVNRKVILN